MDVVNQSKSFVHLRDKKATAFRVKNSVTLNTFTYRLYYTYIHIGNLWNANTESTTSPENHWLHRVLLDVWNVETLGPAQNVLP